MITELYDFLVQQFGKDNVVLGYPEMVAGPGLTVAYMEDGVDTQKNLDGTTNILEWNFIVGIWHNSYQLVLDHSQQLFEAMEGTKFQIQNMRSVREARTKRKWYRTITIRIMEDK